jgi:hypothetical protein
LGEPLKYVEQLTNQLQLISLVGAVFLGLSFFCSSSVNPFEVLINQFMAVAIFENHSIGVNFYPQNNQHDG